MNLAVTVAAVFAQQIGVGPIAWQPAAVSKLARMEGSRVTLLAEKRPTHCQQIGIHRAVRTVAKRAVFGYWRVFKQERPAFFSMTLKAGVIQRGFDQLSLRDRPVRIMAVDTGRTTFQNRMPRL